MTIKFIIVDENDKVIGSKDRADITQNDIYRVSALWVTNRKGDVLLAKRALTKKHDPGKWGPAVAGTVEEGESYEENIYKEAKEEIGLKGVKFQTGQKKRIFGEHPHFTQCFIAVIDTPIEEFFIQKDEVAEIRWFTKDDLKKEIKENPDRFLKSVRDRVEEF